MGTKELTDRNGVIAYADSLDCVGVMGQSVDVVREVFSECCGADGQLADSQTSFRTQTAEI